MSEDPDLPVYTFTPVPTARARHDGWSPLLQSRFITLLALTGSVSHAARSVGKSATSAYNLRRRAGAESFAAAWDSALEEGRIRAYNQAVDRAVNGVAVPRYYRGKLVGMRRVYDYRLALAALNPNPYARLAHEVESPMHAFQAYIDNLSAQVDGHAPPPNGHGERPPSLPPPDAPSSGIAVDAGPRLSPPASASAAPSSPPPARGAG